MGHSHHIKRKQEETVYKLHFEYGYSARKIATMIKANRNTVNSNISFWYGQIQKDEDRTSGIDWINKIFCRLEARRVRLMEKMEKTESLGDWMLIEKMVNEIDIKTMQILVKLESTEKTSYDRVMKKVNDFLKENGYEERYVLWGQTISMSNENSAKVKRIIESDRLHKNK
ncbi:hypothetical protein [Nitrosopumilus sp.]|uniref:hypothetical protein n=1 Tax=Nitrosopumilus sp. TaxID=2024843 RepID=UPI003B5AE3B1